MPRRYLDHASTAPTRPEAVEAMYEWQRGAAGDPGRIHAEGMRARHAVEEAREAVAALLGARSREVVFTSGATESIVSAIEGTAGRGTHLVVPAIEHSAVRLTAQRLAERRGDDLTVIGCDRTGRVDADEVIAAIGPGTALVNLQWGNHEVGTEQPVRRVVEACREHGVLVHVDAAQAVGHTEVDFGALGADLLSFSSHKFGGPTGVGGLLIRRGLRIDPLLLGDDRERARRAGFENVAGIIGLGAVCKGLHGATLAAEESKQRALAEQIIDGVATLPGLRLYGNRRHRLPHIVCLGVEGVEPQAVLLGLDQIGVSCHSGSACSSEDLQPSPVLEAMGVDAHHSLRISMGWNTSEPDVEQFLDDLPLVVDQLRSLGA